MVRKQRQDIQHNGMQHNDIQHNGVNWDSIKETQQTDTHYAECRGALKTVYKLHLQLCQQKTQV
jgi:hypothetical protein